MAGVTPRCPACGYDLTGRFRDGVRDHDEQIVCSECGRSMRAGEAISAGLEVARPVRVPGWMLLSVVGAAAVVVLWLVARFAQLF